MSGGQDTQREGAVTFLPHHLNRQPVVVRGLTADELWVCAGLSAVVGFALGIPLAWLTFKLAMLPTLIVAAIAVGVFSGGGALRRHKRGRPDTWLYQQLQWRIALRHSAFTPYVGCKSLVTRSGYWTTRRGASRAASRMRSRICRRIPRPVTSVWCWLLTHALL